MGLFRISYANLSHAAKTTIGDMAHRAIGRAVGRRSHPSAAGAQHAALQVARPPILGVAARRRTSDELVAINPTWLKDMH